MVRRVPLGGNAKQHVQFAAYLRKGRLIMHMPPRL